MSTTNKWLTWYCKKCGGINQTLEPLRFIVDKSTKAGDGCCFCGALHIVPTDIDIDGFSKVELANQTKN